MWVVGLVKKASRFADPCRTNKQRFVWVVWHRFRRPSRHPKMLRHTLWLLLATAMAAPAVDSAKSSARYEQVTIQHGGGETETLSLMVLTVRVPQCHRCRSSGHASTARAARPAQDGATS